jgi:S-adenosyl methyltransferase
MSDTPPINTHNPHSARVYDYWLGGKNNYQADEAAAEYITTIWPAVRRGAQHNRAFMHRATRYLVREAGIRQFLDIGTGIPTEPNLHQIAQGINPSARVVYADNDPIVLVYASALLRSTTEGRLAYLNADATDPDAILGAPELAETLDLGEPVALSMVALLHLISDERGAARLVERLLAALPSGSYLLLSHATADLNPELMARVADAYRPTATGGQLRTRGEILRFFDGLELADPGVVVTSRWRPDPGQRLPKIADDEICAYAGVARKP